MTMTNDELAQAHKVAAQIFGRVHGMDGVPKFNAIADTMDALIAEVRRLQAQNELLQKLNTLYQSAIPDDD